MNVVDCLRRAREAYERREWVAAFDTLSGTDAGLLHGDDFARLATAAYLTGRTNDSIQAMQRAYQLHLDAGDPLAAVRCAFWLAMTLLTTGESAVGSGWVARAERLLEQAPGDVAEHGYVCVAVLFRHLTAGEYAEAACCADRVTDYGRRFGCADLVAMGLSAQGRLAIYAGRVREGLALLDEAMAHVAADGVSTLFAGHIYCSLVEACQEISDFARMEQWTVALTSWCADQQGLVLFTGQCAVHRGQLMRVHGAYDAALEEFGLAVRRYLAAETVAPAGLASAERGDVLRIRGAFAEADAAYTAAIGYGHDPQPGLALLWAARGRTAAAVATTRRLVAETPDPVHRSQVLPAAVDILLAARETADAAELSTELTAVAAGFDCAALRATAARAAGCVATATGDHATAVTELRRAARLWSALDVPYETARSRTDLGRALRALGDEGSAGLEFDAARRVFARLGAAPAEAEATRLLAPTTPGGLTAREVEVLRLVAAGRSNPQIAAQLVLSEKTIARHLSNIFTKLDVTSRTAAAAFAYEHDLT
ncbi:LuxR C-terminal-related transcriptional regulator [Nocardia sp. NPDC059177]|uniref:LuxR C-terminal-related transcriptional regulator n=1 Tax=Nocardia sp. NPDC059177 TaxID=3346759 RepID=UPI0036927252